MPPSFVLCHAAQRLVFGAVTGEGDGALTLMAPEGSVQIRKHQVLLRWEDPAAERLPRGADRTAAEEPLAGRGVRPEALHALLVDKWAALEATAARLPLAALAERLPKGRVLPLDEIAAALDLADTAERSPRIADTTVSDPWRRAALCLALVQDRQRFRREKGGFVALDPVERTQRETRAAAARAQQDLAEAAETWAAGLERGQWLGAGHPLAPAFLAALVSLAAHERHSPHWTSLGRALLLHEHGALSVARKLKPWLAAAGVWPGWPALWLERAAVSRAFPTEALAEAARIAQLPVETEDRTDRRGLTPYTIDATSTFDYDDAYSVQDDGGGLVASVHIAEPLGDLAPGHPVFDEAERRLSSVYTEEGVFPLLPPALSLGRFSLVRGRPREAFTFRFRVTDGGLEWLGLERSVIEVRANLDYAQTEQLLRDEPATWGRLAQACEAQAQDRARRGAQLAERKDVRLDLSDPARVRLSIVPRGGASTRIVEELAIAFNLAAGLYCQRHGVPALYRVQAGVPSRAGAAGLAQTRFTHARFSTNGAPHIGIACERYVQATSPNRRFADLAMQRQVAAHAAGQPVPFSAERLAAWADRIEARLAVYEEAERAIQEHWVRVYLTQNPQTEAWGTVRKVDGAAARVWLDELALPAEAEASGRLTVGKRQRFRVSAADPDQQRVWVTPV